MPIPAPENRALTVTEVEIQHLDMPDSRVSDQALGIPIQSRAVYLRGRSDFCEVASIELFYNVAVY